MSTTDNGLSAETHGAVKGNAKRLLLELDFLPDDMANCQPSPEALARLRESLESFEQDQYDAGYEFGQQWAEATATAGELCLLEQHMKADPSFDPESVFGALGRDDDATCFWINAVGERHPSEPMAHGFCVGALEYWQAAKSLL